MRAVSCLAIQSLLSRCRSDQIVRIDFYPVPQPLLDPRLCADPYTSVVVSGWTVPEGLGEQKMILGSLQGTEPRSRQIEYGVKELWMGGVGAPLLRIEDWVEYGMLLCYSQSSQGTYAGGCSSSPKSISRGPSKFFPGGWCTICTGTRKCIGVWETPSLVPNRICKSNAYRLDTKDEKNEGSRGTSFGSIVVSEIVVFHSTIRPARVATGLSA